MPKGLLPKQKFTIDTLSQKIWEALTNPEKIKKFMFGAEVITDWKGGFMDSQESISFNKKLRDELHFPNEQKIDNTKQTPEETANQIIAMLEA